MPRVQESSRITDRLRAQGIIGGALEARERERQRQEDRFGESLPYDDLGVLPDARVRAGIDRGTELMDTRDTLRDNQLHGASPFPESIEDLDRARRMDPASFHAAATAGRLSPAAVRQRHAELSAGGEPVQRRHLDLGVREGGGMTPEDREGMRQERIQQGQERFEEVNERRVAAGLSPIPYERSPQGRIEARRAQQQAQQRIRQRNRKARRERQLSGSAVGREILRHEREEERREQERIEQLRQQGLEQEAERIEREREMVQQRMEWAERIVRREMQFGDFADMSPEEQQAFIERELRLIEESAQRTDEGAPDRPQVREPRSQRETSPESQDRPLTGDRRPGAEASQSRFWGRRVMRENTAAVMRDPEFRAFANEVGERLGAERADTGNYRVGVDRETGELVWVVNGEFVRSDGSPL